MTCDWPRERRPSEGLFSSGCVHILYAVLTVHVCDGGKTHCCMKFPRVRALPSLPPSLSISLIYLYIYTYISKQELHGEKPPRPFPICRLLVPTTSWARVTPTSPATVNIRSTPHARTVSTTVYTAEVQRHHHSRSLCGTLSGGGAARVVIFSLIQLLRTARYVWYLVSI